MGLFDRLDTISYKLPIKIMSLYRTISNQILLALL